MNPKTKGLAVNSKIELNTFEAVLTKRIHIELYSPTWASTFQEFKAVYQRQLGNLIIDVQHVGSTAVPGLAAKPVVDIDLVIDRPEKLNAVIEKLASLGYVHRGNQGIADREVFKATSAQTPSDGSLRTWPKHHLYVCRSESLSLKNHLALRDFLRQNPEKAAEYGALKRRLAVENPVDMDLYIERKTPFILAILTEVGFDDASIDAIMQENRASD